MLSNRIFHALVVVDLMAAVFLFLCVRTALGAEKISVGMTLPNIVLTAPEEGDIKVYLGLKNLKSFTVSQIRSKYVLIEFFSLYCPICQKQAPTVNRLYKAIRQNPDLNRNVKMIGIGTGNNQREIEVYKDTLKVPFPLFCDPSYKIHKKVGEPRTPFIVLATNKGKVLLTHSGVIEDTDEFIGKIEKIQKQP